jgi:hypothetical protein
MARPLILALGLAAGLAVAGGAQAKDKDKEDVAAFRAVLDCRTLKDDAQRLACYDAATARMGEAETKGDIVVIDRAKATQAHKEAFGLPIPSLAFVTKALKPEEVNRLDGLVEAARADANGDWTLRLQGGAVWRQISGDLSRPPHAGSKVSIRKGTLGSFLMNVDDQPSIKVHRDQ